ncbi:MAG: MFS transporter [Deltaproteobacteria bacterium]|jgi:sugar phosphate permease|nr:MFS transporter [Deltaproteobacteria bacterium]
MKLRYKILAILFIGWVVSYLDRMVMTVAIPYIAQDFQLQPVEVGAVISAFFLGYAILQLPGGMLADRLGPRRVMILGISWWTVFTVITGFIGSLKPMLAVRALFGVGEGVFPAASWKTIANWFPAKERTTANGFMMSSTFFGPAIAPLFVVAIMSAWGWRAVFFSLLIPGVLLVLLLLKYASNSPDEHPRISSKELAEIKGTGSGSAAASVKKVSFAQVIRSPVAWQCFLIWFFFDITFWGFMSWVPSYLVNERGYEMVKMGITASVPFFAGTLGLILGGWLSDNVFANRRAFFVCIAHILGGIAMYFTYHASHELIMPIMSATGLLIGIAFGAFWGLPMSVMPPEVMGAASGFVNTAGQIAGFVAPLLMGYLIQSHGSYYSAFMVLSGSFFVAAIIAATVRKTQV